MDGWDSVLCVLWKCEVYLTFSEVLGFPYHVFVEDIMIRNHFFLSTFLFFSRVKL